MKFKHTWKGDTDLMKTFRALSSAVSRDVLADALTESAEPIRSAASALAPRGRGRGPHLADNIVVGVTQFGDGGQVSNPDVVTVAIGPSHQPHDMFYGMFQEFGTAHHPAQPFMRPAFDQRHKESRRMFGAAVSAAVARRFARRSA